MGLVFFGIFFYIFIQFDLRHPVCGSPYQQKESIEITVVLFSGFLFSWYVFVLFLEGKGSKILFQKPWDQVSLPVCFFAGDLRMLPMSSLTWQTSIQKLMREGIIRLCAATSLFMLLWVPVQLPWNRRLSECKAAAHSNEFLETFKMQIFSVILLFKNSCISLNKISLFLNKRLAPWFYCSM